MVTTTNRKIAEPSSTLSSAGEISPASARFDYFKILPGLSRRASQNLWIRFSEVPWLKVNKDSRKAQSSNPTQTLYSCLQVIPRGKILRVGATFLHKRYSHWSRFHSWTSGELTSLEREFSQDHNCNIWTVLREEEGWHNVFKSRNNNTSASAATNVAPGSS